MRRCAAIAQRLFHFTFAGKNMNFFSKSDLFVLNKLRTALAKRLSEHLTPNFEVPPVTPQQQRLLAHRRRNTKTSYLEIFERLERLMRRNQVFLRQDLNSTKLAKMAGTNRVYLSQTVKICTGDTVRDYVAKFRVNFAMQTFMRTPTLRVSDLAFVSGFNSSASFNNAFKRINKTTPGLWCLEYRRNLAARK